MTATIGGNNRAAASRSSGRDRLPRAIKKDGKAFPVVDRDRRRRLLDHWTN